MLEAVNSVLSNASYTKAIADQQSVANSYAANPARVQQASTAAPYISLYIKMDVNFDKALLQIRDRDTGDVVRQIPSETQLEAYRRAQTSNAVRPATAEETAPVYVEETELSAPTSDADVTVSTSASIPQSSSAVPSVNTGISAPAPTSVDTTA